MQRTFFISDSHFGHANIIKFVKRPFKDVTVMDEFMVNMWNETVRPNDLIWHLGDFTFRKPDIYIPKLNGRINLILGNHDTFAKRHYILFNYVCSYRRVKISGADLILFHYPILSWDKRIHGSYHFHGHTHSSRILSADTACLNQFNRRYNICVEALNYKPKTFEEIIGR